MLCYVTIQVLNGKGYAEPLREYIKADRPFFGICLGMQTLFEGSEECPGVAVRFARFPLDLHPRGRRRWGLTRPAHAQIMQQGLGVIKGIIKRFDPSPKFSVPHIGWNGLLMQKHTKIIHAIQPEELVYFVHSYRAVPSPEAAPWALTLTTYGANFIRYNAFLGGSFPPFVGGRSIVVGHLTHTHTPTLPFHNCNSAVQQGRVMATQFHPEKSGNTGLRILKTFLDK